MSDTPSPAAPRRAHRGWIWPALIALWAAPALAAPPAAPTEEPRIQFVDMSEMLIDGAAVKPQVMLIDVRKKVRFERLFDLKRPVLHRLRETARDTALR